MLPKTGFLWKLQQHLTCSASLCLSSFRYVVSPPEVALVSRAKTGNTSRFDAAEEIDDECNCHWMVSERMF